MPADIIDLPCVTSHDLPPDRVLETAIGQMEGVLVIGYDLDGKEYFASSYADGGNMLWLLERCKLAILRGGPE